MSNSLLAFLLLQLLVWLLSSLMEIILFAPCCYSPLALALLIEKCVHLPLTRVIHRLRKRRKWNPHISMLRQHECLCFYKKTKPRVAISNIIVSLRCLLDLPVSFTRLGTVPIESSEGSCFELITAPCDVAKAKISNAKCRVV